MKRIAALTAATVALGIAAAAPAQDAAPKPEIKPLHVGDKAPELDIAHWLKGGKPVTKFENGKVYVVEFWATWCPPCRASMPHLSSLQQEYKDYDVTVIGVSDEPLQTVYDFMFKKDKGDNKVNNDRTGYTVTTDPDRSVHTSYMKASGQSGIPTAFIVGKNGHVEWIGHPMSMDEPLAAVVRDTWDRDEFSSRMKREKKAAQDYKKFHEMIASTETADEGYILGKKVVESMWDNAEALNAISWFVVDNNRVAKRDLGFAKKVASRACELTKYKNPAILDTLARVYFEKGDIESAIKYQTMAVEHAGDDRMGEGIREALKKYEAARGG